MTGRQTHQTSTGPQTGQENREGADQATRDNDLTTGHGDPDDGGADNAKGNAKPQLEAGAPLRPLAASVQKKE